MNRRPLLAALAVPLAGCGGFADVTADDPSSNGADDDPSSNGADDEPLFETTVLWVVVLPENGGDPVPNVDVTVLKPPDYRAERETRSDGSAFFEGLEAGEYGISVETRVGSTETTIELEEGDDGEIEVEVPVPE